MSVYIVVNKHGCYINFIIYIGVIVVIILYIQIILSWLHIIAKFVDDVIELGLVDFT